MLRHKIKLHNGISSLRNGKVEKANGSLKTQGREKKRKVKKNKIVEKCVEVFISVKCKWTERGGWNVEGEKIRRANIHDNYYHL